MQILSGFFTKKYRFYLFNSFFFRIFAAKMDSLINIHRPVTICKASAGTGKTYTLAAYYIGLLLSGEDYRSILAITFTNKATAEMSERILAFLHGIAEGGETAFLNYARSFMLRNAQADEASLRRRAGECFRQMLLDYDNVQVQTIDSFLQTLLSGLAGILHESAGLHTELDVKHVIEQAVDQLLATDLTAADRAILEDYMQVKLDQESHWNVRQSLCDLAMELYNESVQMLDAEGKILFDAPAIARRRAAIEQRWANDPQVAQLRDILRSCNPTDYNRYTKAAYDRLGRSVEAPEKVSGKDRFRGVSKKFCNADEMATASALAENLGKTYNSLFLTIRMSRDMELMASLQAIIQRNLAEANCALLARTASTLTNALRTGDADFILEKAGIRFKHVLMDEFQDTSQLQWRVIRQLLMDVLAGAGNTLLIVGDIKQSIYRWRNGDWHIMDELTSEGMNELTKDRINERFTSLTRNFRSSEEVVKFNLTLFDHIINAAGDDLTKRIYSEGFTPEALDQYYQSDKKKGGYVRFQAKVNAKKEDLALEMLAQIEDLLQKGANPSDIMILVREKKEAAMICGLTDLPIVSADSFLLEASTDVQLLIAALRYRVHNDPVAKRFVEQRVSSPDVIEQIQAVVTDKTPLYEAICELIRILLTDAEGHYTGTETAYLNALLDRTREYVGAYGSDMEQFLIYWDDTMHGKSIPVTSSNAIQIMTIHASKGLQAQTIFVPFATWEREDGKHKPKIWCPVSEKVDETGDFVPIPFGDEMAESDYSEACTDERTNMRIDNLNMLYVALTRAEDNLFVYTAYSVNKDGKRGACNHVGKYLMDAFGEDYEAGTPVIKAKSQQLTAKSQTADLWSNSDQVRFVQSQEGALYTENGEEAYRRLARMEEGTLCHEIFANIRKADELDQVLDAFETRGEIRDKAQREELRSLISSAWEGSPEMRDWFTAPWELRLEEAIYIDERELRPDRVMINPNTHEAIVLDYKFGNWNEHYITQVSEYKQALSRMGYNPVRGYLWFAREKKLVLVKS